MSPEDVECHASCSLRRSQLKVLVWHNTVHVSALTKAWTSRNVKEISALEDVSLHQRRKRLRFGQDLHKHVLAGGAVDLAVSMKICWLGFAGQASLVAMDIEGKGATNWSEFENAVGDFLKSSFHPDAVTKPRFKSTERQANDSCTEPAHRHQPPSSKTSNPDWIVTELSGDKEIKIVNDAKYYRASKLTAHDLDKLRSDMKSHGADHGVMIVHTDGTGTIPMNRKLSTMAVEHRILILSCTAGRYPHIDRQSKDILASLIAKPGLPSRTARALAPAANVAPAQQNARGLLMMGNSGALDPASKPAVGRGAGASKATAAATAAAGRNGAETPPWAGAAATGVIAFVAVTMSIAAIAAIDWGISRACEAGKNLEEARKVAEGAQSSKEVDGYGDRIQGLQQELDECRKIVSDARMNGRDTEAFCALAVLHLLVSGRIPTLLHKIQDVASEMGDKMQFLQEQEKQEERRRDESSEGESDNTKVAVLSGLVCGEGLLLSSIGAVFPPILAVTIPMAVGGAGTAVGTGVASSDHSKTKRVTEEILKSIPDQMDKLEDLQGKCDEVLSQGVELLHWCLQQVAPSKL